MDKLVYNQSRASYSAPVAGTPIPDEFVMQGIQLEYGDEWEYASSSKEGCIFDGTNIWLKGMGMKDDTLTRINIKSGEHTYFPMVNGVNGNSNLPTEKYGGAGGVFDGKYIWLLPYFKDALVRVDTNTGTMTGFSTSNGVNGNSNLNSNEFTWTTGIFDGECVWIHSRTGMQLVKLDTETGTLTGTAYIPKNVGASPNTVQQILFDGTDIFVIPYSTYRTTVNSGTNPASRLYKFNPKSLTGTWINYDEGTGFSTAETNEKAKFDNATCDGEYIYITTPLEVLRLEISTNKWSSYPSPEITGVNYACLSDGKHLWVAGHHLVCYTLDGKKTVYPWEGENIIEPQQCYDMAYDGKSLWMVGNIPGGGEVITKISPASGETENFDLYLLLKMEESKNLLATLLPSGTRPENAIWSSDDPDVALVDSNGVVIGISPGESKITVQTIDGKFSASIMVEVLPIEDTELRLSIHLKVDEACRLMAKFQSTKEDAQPIWSSEDDSVASVNEAGIVTAHTVGEVYITATVDDVSESVHVIVTE